MDTPNFQIKLIDKMIDASYFTDIQTRIEASEALDAVHRDGFREAWCFCTNSPRRLEIIKKKQKTSVVFLRIEKKDREHHHPMCPVRLKGEGIETYCAVPNFKVDGDTLLVASGISLQESKNDTPSKPSGEDGYSHLKNEWENYERRRTGLGGLLNLGISESGLNHWNPKHSRTSFDYVDNINSVLERVQINGINLDKRLYICGTTESDKDPQGDLFTSSIRAFCHMLESESKKRGSKAKGVIFDQITSIHIADGITTLRGKYLGDTIQLTESQANAIKKSYDHEWSAIGKNDCFVFGLFLVSVDTEGQIQIESTSLSLTSKDYFHVESCPEAIMVNRLIAEKRCFMKPYRQWNDSRFFPDFKLLDTNTETLIEVWGMNTKEYVKQKLRKIKYYKSIVGIILIEWNVKDCDIQSVLLPPPTAFTL